VTRDVTIYRIFLCLTVNRRPNFQPDARPALIRTPRVVEIEQSTTEARYTIADKSLARPTSRCILFDGESISFDASLVIYINSTNIPPIMIINRIYGNKNLLSL